MDLTFLGAFSCKPNSRAADWAAWRRGMPWGSRPSYSKATYFSVYALEIQIPSKKVVWGVFRRLNTFSEGSWIHRVHFFGEGWIVVSCGFSPPLFWRWQSQQKTVHDHCFVFFSKRQPTQTIFVVRVKPCGTSAACLAGSIPDRLLHGQQAAFRLLEGGIAG